MRDHLLRVAALGRSLSVGGLLLAVVLALAACDVARPSRPGGDGPAATAGAPQPVAAVTVTEVVTVAPDGEPADPCAAPLDQHGFIFVTRPTPGRAATTPLRVQGCANTFEATIEWRLLGERDQEELAAGTATATCGSGCVGTFGFEVEFEVDRVQVGALEVYETSPEDGAVQQLTRVPLVLRP